MIGTIPDNPAGCTAGCSRMNQKYLKQYWYPIREIGGVKNANLEAAVNPGISRKKIRSG